MARFGIGSLVLVGCFAPTPQPGAPCANGTCPTGLTCQPSTNTCELENRPIDSGATQNDARPDAPPDALDAFVLLCYGMFDPVCPMPPVTMPLTISLPTQIDTDSSPLCLASEPDACVLAGTTVSIEAVVTATGVRPLAILATSTLTIDGTIDVSSSRGGAVGAGSELGCGNAVAATGLIGGPGGSFGGVGGVGGLAAGMGAGLPANLAASNVTSLHGGCRGSDGSGTTPGIGGRGGGVVWLIGSSITINGSIDASGAGGGAAEVLGGGGGGGSGGMVILDSSSVTVGSLGQIFANGGGGGEGATQNNSGTPGEDASAAIVAAQGGENSSPKGGNGGNGALGVTAAREGLNGGQCGRGDVGGGGGGGGVGIIRVIPFTSLGGTISPPAT